MNARTSISVTPIFVADLLAEDERMPLYVHVIDHPDARVLVDTGIKELHPAVADLDPRLSPLNEQDFDLAGIEIVVNTHLHFDHCGGNHLFAGKPIYVQRRELDDALTEDEYTIREWVEAPGVRYVPVDGSGCAHSTPSSSGSRTSTSRGDPAPSKGSRGSLAKFLPAGDPGLTIHTCRWCDGRLSPRSRSRSSCSHCSLPARAVVRQPTRRRTSS
jgi:hypothetical protein